MVVMLFVFIDGQSLKHQRRRCHFAACVSALFGRQSHESQADKHAQEITTNRDRQATEELRQQLLVSHLHEDGGANESNQQQNRNDTELNQIGRDSSSVMVGVIECTANEDAQVPFVAVLNGLYAQENSGAYHSDQRVNSTALVVTVLGSPNTECHREATEEQHDRVHRTEILVQEMVSLVKDLGVMDSVKRVGNEQSAEEQNFGHQENPDSKLARIELLFSRLEMVSNERIVVMMFFEDIFRIGYGHDWLRGIRQNCVSENKSWLWL